MPEKKAATRYQKGKIYKLPVDLIQPDPEQPRKTFSEEAMKELSVSIARHGVLQPIIFRKGEQDEIILVSGERRVRAAKDAGETEIPAIYNNGDPTEIALVENLLREDLTPIEEAEALLSLKEKKNNCSDAEIGEIIGKGRSTITEILSLNHLPKAVRDECRENRRYPLRELKKIASSKKKAKTMLREFKELKARLDKKDEHGGGRSGNREKIVILSETVDSLTSKFDKALQKLTDVEKVMAKDELMKLKEQIEVLLEKY